MKKTVITIARSYGSGGRTLGKLLAEELGINCYDREILRMASDDSGINEALFGQTDEKLKKSPLFRIARKNPYKGGVIPPESADFVSDDNLFNYQAKVIRELAEEESCIIIGRCADYVLKDDPNVLRLFFFAPKEDCIVRVMEHDGITGRDAENKIEKIDKHRADYYKYYTGKDWYDARNYDFCLDTTSMGYEKLVEVVGWLGLPAGAVCRSPMYLHEKEYYTAFLWVAIIKRKVCQRETLKNVASLCGVPSLNRCPPHNDHHNLKKSFALGSITLL